MALPFSFEDTLRIHDEAIAAWLSNLHVDYNYIDHNVLKNDVPIIMVFSSPMREFASVVNTLVKTGWITGSSPVLQAQNAGDFSILPLPVLTIRRGDPEPDSELSAPAKQFRTKAYNPLTGQYEFHPWPGYYRTTYTVTLWSMKFYSDNFMREWVMSYFGANRGANYKEYMLPVQHKAPWGLMLQALRFDGSSDLSDLEGEDHRYIRVEFTFSLRTLFMRLPIIPPNGEGTPLNRLTVEAAIPGSNYGNTDLVDQVDESLGYASVQSLNLFNVPFADFLIPTLWPVTGTATVSRGRLTPGGSFMKPTPGANPLYFEVAGSTDSAPIVNRQVLADTNGDAITSISFRYRSNGPVMLECTQEDPTTGIISMAYELELPAQTQWTNIHVFTIVKKNIFSWNIAGISSNPRYGITVADVDCRHISTLTQIPPSQVLTTGSETQYLWYNLPPGPALVVALLSTNTGLSDTLSVDNDITSPTSTNIQPVSEATNSGLVALTQPSGNTIRARVPLTVTLASIGLQPYAGYYNGHALSQT